MTPLYEDEFEDFNESEAEEEAFFGSLARLASRAVQSPALRRVASAAGRAALGGLRTLGSNVLQSAGSQIGQGIGSAVNRRLFGAQQEAEFEDELEWEGEWEEEMFVNPLRRWYPDAMMEHLGKSAAEAETEEEAFAFLAPLVPLAARFAPQIASTVMRAAPQLIRGVGNIAGTLMRGNATRPLVRTLPTIVQRTANTLAQQARRGQPVTPQTAVRTLARQAANVIGNPQQAVQAFRRSQALDRRYHQAGPRPGAPPAARGGHGRARRPTAPATGCQCGQQGQSEAEYEGEGFDWPWTCRLGCTKVRDPDTGIERCEKFPGSRCTGTCRQRWWGGCCCSN